MGEKPSSHRQQESAGGIRSDDERPSSDGIEEASEYERPKEVSDCEWQNVVAHALGQDGVELGQRKRISKEDCIVEECLRDHQREHKNRASPIRTEKGASDPRESDFTLQPDHHPPS